MVTGSSHTETANRGGKTLFRLLIQVGIQTRLLQQDKIDLHAFGITAAQVKAVVSGKNLILSIDADHNGSADFTITLTTHINSSDYVF